MVQFGQGLRKRALPNSNDTCDDEQDQDKQDDDDDPRIAVAH
jgi:hypothetical protein